MSIFNNPCLQMTEKHCIMFCMPHRLWNYATCRRLSYSYNLPLFLVYIGSLTLSTAVLADGAELVFSCVVEKLLKLLMVTDKVKPSTWFISLCTPVWNLLGLVRTSEDFSSVSFCGVYRVHRMTASYPAVALATTSCYPWTITCS